MSKTMLKRFTSPYSFLLLLLFCMIAGGITGAWMGPSAHKLKPLGDIFLNLIFTAVTPLVFFSVASAIANISDIHKIGTLFCRMIGLFILTGGISAFFMLIVVKLYPPAQGVFRVLPTLASSHPINLGEQIVGILTVPDFTALFSRQNMLALIFFALLLGFSVAQLGESAKPFARFLSIGADVFMKIIAWMMYYAPIGFFAYFAVLIADLGPHLVQSYLRALIIYLGAGFIYFVVMYSLYAWLAYRKAGVYAFWREVPLPFMTALATCSSAASIPANLHATHKMGVPLYICETTIPLGTLLHKEGSVLGGILKIAFLLGVFHMPLAGAWVLCTAVVVGILVGTVMGAIPSGGMIAELLILSLYKFPPEALILIAPITLLIDAPATALNVCGNSVSALLLARWSSCSKH